MALTKEKKHEVVAQIGDLLDSAKMTVVVSYKGTPVKALQTLRRDSRQNGTVVKVVKNRLVIKALESSDKFKGADRSALEGMLLYAFNDQDEVAPAQAISNFAKTQPTLEFVGAYNADGQFINASDVKELADLPSKEVLRAQLVGTIGAPLSGFVNVMAGNVRGVLNVLNARADALK